MKVEKILEQIKTNRNYQLCCLILLFVLLSLFIRLTQKNDGDSAASGNSFSSSLEGVDTYIPKDHVLVPLNLLNQDSLNGIINGRAVVDLYDEKMQLRASSIRIIQAPGNSEAFAALVRTKDSAILLRHKNGFYATIRNQEDAKQTQVQGDGPAVAEKVIYGGISL